MISSSLSKAYPIESLSTFNKSVELACWIVIASCSTSRASGLPLLGSRHLSCQLRDLQVQGHSSYRSGCGQGDKLHISEYSGARYPQYEDPKLGCCCQVSNISVLFVSLEALFMG